MNNGWIALHRKILDWEWWDDHNTTRLFLYLLLKANHEPKKWRGIEIDRGQLATGLHSLKKGTGISVQSLRTSLNRLISTNEITKQSTSKYTLITIVRYSDYQDKDSKVTKHPTSKLTNNQQTTNKQLTTNNNITIKQLNNKKKKSNKRKNFKKPTIKDLKNYIQEKKLNVDADQFFDHYEGNGWKIGKNPMKDWQATVRNWHRRNQPKKKKHFENERTDQYEGIF